MALRTIKATIQMRHGKEEDFDPDQMTSGEWGVSDDTKKVWMCFMPGLVLRMATYEAFEEDMKKIQAILQTCKDIQVAVEQFVLLAEQHSNTAERYSKESKSWAIGGTGTRIGEDTDNSKYHSEQSKYHSERSEYYSELAKEYSESRNGSLFSKGEISFSDLPTTGNKEGEMYNIQESFVSDSRFKDGAGYSFPSGTNVCWTSDGKWDCLTGNLRMELTLEEYNALSESEKMNGTTYYITDANSSSGSGGGSAGTIIIDDTLSSTSENPVQNKVITNKIGEISSVIQERNVRYKNGNLQYFDQGNNEWITIENGGSDGGGGSSVKLNPPSNIAIINLDESCEIKWTDPTNVIIEGFTLAEWAGTVVVRKAGAAPQNKNDGVIVVDSKVRDQYSENGFIDNGLTNGVEYYYGIFPYTDGGAYTTTSVTEFIPEPIYPSAATGILLKKIGNQITISFQIPENATSASITYKIGSAPTMPYDGTEILNATSPYTIMGLTEGEEYYFVVYTHIAKNGTNRSTPSEAVSIILSAVVIYGLEINQKNESDPDSMVTYIEDNENFTPAHMDYKNDVFNYGDWENAWFIPRPCMLNSDGTVAYYLNPDDYTLKENGTPSDVDNVDFDGNVMVEFPKIYWKIVNNGENTVNIYISNVKLDDDFACWSHIDNNGNEMDYFYVGAYNGSLHEGKLRSLSQQKPMTNKTTQQEINYAKANHQGNDNIWYTDVFSDRTIINILLLLIGKSTNAQKIFGTGNNSRSTQNLDSVVEYSGTMDKKGLFWGNQDNVSGVKVFGIEHYWGNLMRRTAGWISEYGTQKIKLTYGMEDGSSVYGYNTNGSGYISINNSTPSGVSGGYVSKMKFTNYCMIPIETNGSATTYFTDGFWFNNNYVTYSVLGGNSPYGLKTGIFCSAMDSKSEETFWYVGTSLSCKPLASMQKKESV